MKKVSIFKKIAVIGFVLIAANIIYNLISVQRQFDAMGTKSERTQDYVENFKRLNESFEESKKKYQENRNNYSSADIPTEDTSVESVEE